MVYFSVCFFLEVKINITSIHPKVAVEINEPHEYLMNIKQKRNVSSINLKQFNSNSNLILQIYKKLNPGPAPITNAEIGKKLEFM